ncbi:hypothetical protein [Desulfovibrio cuneatus]|uniref:hypothetical protein n=1 Tax=Desulfovibrio cuneatus TaxID=159728 RepID=UPI0004139C1D|nr:hypothetical protein [Desulfovibrio cuneatus]
MFERSGKNLIITAEDGGHIILDGFFGFAHETEMPVFVLPGDILVEAKDLMPLIDNTFESFRPNGAPCLLGDAAQPEGLHTEAALPHDAVPGYLPQAAPLHNLPHTSDSQPQPLRFQDVLEDDKPHENLFPQSSAELPPNGAEISLSQQEHPVNAGEQPAGEAPLTGGAHAEQHTQGGLAAQPVGTEEEALHALLQHQSIVG